MNPEEEDDKLHFKPIVQLEKVEVKSGEELEEMVFCGRAKLYRFDREGNQWKERGAGELKMLKKSDSGQVRVLMRRDQVKKVCANHFITPDMKLERSQMAQNAWIWFTHADYSEETPKAEQLLARFKSADLSQKFGQCFNEAKSSAAKVKTSSPVSAQIEDESKQTQLGSPDKQSVPDKQIGFSMFAAQPGDWTCELCYVLNTDNRPVCISCQSPNPNITQVQEFETSPRCETETSEVNLEGLVDDDNRSFILSQSKTEDVKFSPKSETSFTRMASPYQSDKALLESGSLSQRYGEDSSSAQLSYPLTLNSQVGSQADTTVNDSSTFKFKSSITTTGLQVDSLGDDIEPSEVDKYFTSPGSEAEPRMKDSEVEVRLLRTPSPPNLVDSFTMTDEIIEERSESPELVITYVKEVTDYGQSKAGDMLLPQTFYSDSAANLSRSEIFESHTKVTVSSGVETQVSDEIEKHTKVAVHPSPVETPASDEIEKHTKVTVHSSPVGTPASDEIEKHTKVTVHSSPVGTPASDEIEKHTKVTVRSSPVKIYVASSGQEATKTSEENTGVLNRNENTASDMHGDDVKSRVPDVPTVTLVKTEVKLKLDPTNEEPSSLEDGETLAFNRNRSSESTDNTTFQFAKVPVISGRRSPMHEAVIVKEDSLEVDKENEPREVTAHDTDELQVVFVKTPTDSQKQRALRLLLPSNFFCEPSQSPRIKTPPEPVHPNLTLTGKEIFSSGKSHPGSSGQSAIFGSSLSTGASFSFLSIASQNNPSGFKINQGHGFLGQGSALFSNFSKNSGEGAEDDSYEPSLPGFEPIVSLSKVEVSSGEEEESELFGERCKLYRFDSSAAQWKERGVGKIRILQHTKTLKSRIVMRREQVHKLCANHFITPAMSLMAKQPGQDNIWLWNTAADISEGEPKQEKFTVKFKNNDLGKRFFTVFEECKLTSSQQKDTSGTQTECQSSQTNELSSDVFTVKPRHTYWTCETCYIENDIVQGLCLGCQTPKSFGTSSPDEKGRASESTQETSVGADQHSQSPDEINEFGIPIKSEVNREKYKDIGTSIFGAGFGTGLAFSSFASMSTTSGFNATPSKTFPGAGRPVLSDKENLETEHTDDGIHVDPIIKLEKVDVTTGEEQEDVIFNSKAKMYRFDQASNQWKERGVGLLKLLRNNETRKSRLIMRRDQICKLCANHLLLPGMKLEPMPSSNRCMMWKTFADLSEGSPEECLLAVRFKTDELVAKFSAVFESLCEGRDISPELVATDGASA